MSERKRMVRIPPMRPGEDWTGPVMVRGWLRVRRPWRRPFAVLTLFRKWVRVKRDVDRAEGFLSFEYWQRLESLTFGMHVGWESNEQLQRFNDCPSHRDIAGWAMASPLICAMKLETMAMTDDGCIDRLGGFYIIAEEGDLSPDALFPQATGRR
jgi:heme-degrading monooxygenase HmoA